MGSTVSKSDDLQLVRRRNQKGFQPIMVETIGSRERPKQHAQTPLNPSSTPGLPIIHSELFELANEGVFRPTTPLKPTPPAPKPQPRQPPRYDCTPKRPAPGPTVRVSFGNDNTFNVYGSAGALLERCHTRNAGHANRRTRMRRDTWAGGRDVNRVHLEAYDFRKQPRRGGCSCDGVPGYHRKVEDWRRRLPVHGEDASCGAKDAESHRGPIRSVCVASSRARGRGSSVYGPRSNHANDGAASGRGRGSSIYGVRSGHANGGAAW